MVGPSERGATLVEYTFILALVVVVGMAAWDAISAAIDDQYEESVDAAEGNWASGGAPPPSEPDEPEEPTTTTRPATTTTTSTTTTTTRPVTTTSTTTTTTTRPSTVSRATLDSPSSTALSFYQWKGSARVTVTDANGRVLAGAQVEVRVTDNGGNTRTVTVTTDSRGVATVEVGPYYNWIGPSRVDLQVVGVTSPGATWNGTSGTVSVTPP